MLTQIRYNYMYYTYYKLFADTANYRGGAPTVIIRNNVMTIYIVRTLGLNSNTERSTVSSEGKSVRRRSGTR